MNEARERVNDLFDAIFNEPLSDRKEKEGRMKKRMEELEVWTEGETVHISQPFPMQDPAQIDLSVKQIDVLIEWLQEAKQEIKGGQSTPTVEE